MYFSSKYNFKSIEKVLLFLLVLVIQYEANGQQAGEIVCPLPGDTVTNGQLLVVFRLIPGLEAKPSNIDIIIDRTSFKSLIKVSGSKISVLCTTPVKQGMKKIRVVVKGTDGKVYDKEWSFYVFNRRTIKENRKFFGIKAGIETYSRFTELTGDDPYLRQEPPSVQHIKFNSRIKYKGVEIPVKIHWTNLEESYLPSRNRFFTGIESKNAGVYFGDINPYYDRLILNGTRVRGVELFLKIRSFGLNIIYGTVNRPVDGLRLYYNSREDKTFPPVNLQDVRYDSTYFEGYYNTGGIYKRNLCAVRFTFGSPNTNNHVHFVISKSTDDTTSISYGNQAGQNFSTGIDFDTKSRDKRLKISGGVAVAFTTRDIKYGVASKETIDNLYGTDIPIEPYKFRKILVFNTTSTMPSGKGTPYLSFYLTPEYRFANQIIKGEVRRIGSDFRSYGNPYLINDRFVVSISDRMHFINKKLSIDLKLRHYNNNLGKSDSVSLLTDMADASFNYLIKQDIPRLNGGYRVYFRTGKDLNTKERKNEYKISNYFGGIIYNLNKWNINSSIVLNYNYNMREEPVRNRTVISQSVYMNLNQDYSFGLLFNLQYNFLLMTNDTSDFGRNNTFGLRIGYHTKNYKFKFLLGATQLHSYETIWLPESERSSITMNIDYRAFGNFTIRIEGGKSSYTEYSGLKRNYDELYCQIGLRYRFSR